MANKKIELDEATFDKINYTYDALHKKYGDDLGGVSFPPPINVVKAGDLQNLKFSAVAPIPQELKDDIAVIKAYSSEIKEEIAELQKKPEKEPKKEAEPAPEPAPSEAKERKSLGKRIWQWFKSDYVYYAVVYFAIVFSTACGIQILYVSSWSDDAWARRAYDVAVKMDAPNPGRIYHETRESFRKDHRHAAKGKVLDIEELYRKHKQDSLSLEKGKVTDSNLNKDFR